MVIEHYRALSMMIEHYPALSILIEQSNAPARARCSLLLDTEDIVVQGTTLHHVWCQRFVPPIFDTYRASSSVIEHYRATPHYNDAADIALQGTTLQGVGTKRLNTPLAVPRRARI